MSLAVKGTQPRDNSDDFQANESPPLVRARKDPSQIASRWLVDAAALQERSREASCFYRKCARGHFR